MPEIPLAAGGLANAVGPLSATAISVIVGTVLIMTVIGKGKKKLAAGTAQMIGVFGELAFLRADGPFHDIGQAAASVDQSLAAEPSIGSIGMTGVTLLLLVLAALAKFAPPMSVIIGLLLGAAMDSAQGSIWHFVVTVLTLPLGLVQGA
ncbi:hypothetical protein ACH4PU_31185 [Streptomyces sp. NPDC021100]|uniref:hypothetical protein n=1 Tax=Streptomyces sp. NPDC021100 TaxID=3365114 RepID=UPI00378EAC09